MGSAFAGTTHRSAFLGTRVVLHSPFTELWARRPADVEVSGGPLPETGWEVR